MNSKIFTFKKILIDTKINFSREKRNTIQEKCLMQLQSERDRGVIESIELTGWQPLKVRVESTHSPLFESWEHVVCVLPWQLEVFWG